MMWTAAERSHCAGSADIRRLRMATRVLHKSLSPIAIVLAASAIVLGLIAVCAADERAGPLPAPFTV
ncbi:MAG: hypothetical protein AAGK78_15640, partial [Planctomycetota bacterium]